MDIIYNKIFLGHDTGNHPENKARLLSYPALKETPIIDGEEFLELIHPASYISLVKEACRQNRSFDQDTRTSPGTWAAAVAAVGAAVMASQSNGFAFVRPPGHHAYRERASGFCIFNNIAIAVERLRRQGKKVLIIDFDGHWGDGTSDIFYQNNDVLYASLHQYPAFPGGGSETEIGSGKGKGLTINVPLPPESGDDVFLKSMDVVMGAALKFKPDAVAVSAGFDSHQHDPLLQLCLSSKAYHRAGEMLCREFRDIFAVLEGGYNTNVMPVCIDNFLAGIHGQRAVGDERSTHSSVKVLEEFDMRLSHLLSAHKGQGLL